MKFFVDALPLGLLVLSSLTVTSALPVDVAARGPLRLVNPALLKPQPSIPIIPRPPRPVARDLNERDPLFGIKLPFRLPIPAALPTPFPFSLFGRDVGDDLLDELLLSEYFAENTAPAAEPAPAPAVAARGSPESDDADLDALVANILLSARGVDELDARSFFSPALINGIIKNAPSIIKAAPSIIKAAPKVIKSIGKFFGFRRDLSEDDVDQLVANLLLSTRDVDSDLEARVIPPALIGAAISAAPTIIKAAPKVFKSIRKFFGFRRDLSDDDITQLVADLFVDSAISARDVADSDVDAQIWNDFIMALSADD